MPFIQFTLGLVTNLTELLRKMGRLVTMNLPGTHPCPKRFLKLEASRLGAFCFKSYSTTNHRRQFCHSDVTLQNE